MHLRVCVCVYFVYEWISSLLACMTFQPVRGCELCGRFVRDDNSFTHLNMFVFHVVTDETCTFSRYTLLHTDYSSGISHHRSTVS